MPNTLLFVTDFLQHYRVGLLRELSDIMDIHIAAGKTNTYSSVPGASIEGSAFHTLQVRRGPGPVRFVWGALRAVNRAKPSVVLVFANVWWPHVWLVTLWCRLRSIPVFHWTHGWGQDDAAVGYLRTACYRLSDHIFVFGNRSRVIGVGRFKYPSDRVSVIWNSLPHVPITDPVAQPPGPDRVEVVLVARLVPGRRVTILIRALAELVGSEGAEVHATVVGEGPERQAAEELAARLGIASRIRFVGALYDEDELREIYRQGSVCAIPGKPGLSVIQAMRYGLPVIIGDDPAEHGPEAEAVEDGRNGAFFRAGDAGSLAQAILRVVGNNAQWRAMSDEALETVERRYSPKRQRDVMLDVLSSTSMGRHRGH
jgi:glycosyltransferase involved in cell wall biosynthesis